MFRAPQHIANDPADEPQKKQQRRNTSLSGVLNVNIVQMSVPSLEERTRNVLGHVVLELNRHLLRADAQVWMRLDHLPARPQHNHAARVGVYLASMRIQNGNYPF